MRSVAIVVVVMMAAAVSGLPTHVDPYSDPLYYNGLREEYEAYKTKYHKSYPTEAENNYRMMLYAAAKKEVAEINQRYKQGLVTWLAAINAFSDMRPDEIPLGYLKDEHHHRQ